MPIATLEKPTSAMPPRNGSPLAVAVQGDAIRLRPGLMEIRAAYSVELNGQIHTYRMVSTIEIEERTTARPNPVGEQFRILADWWHEATDALSSPSLKVQHRAYQQIIGLRQPAVPFILEDLRDHGGYWFYALEKITGMSPLPKDRPASFAAVREAWLKWGSDEGLI